jgi:hypothetical protein
MLDDPAAAFGAMVRFAGLEFDEARLAAAVAAAGFATLQRQEAEKGFRERRLESTAPFFRRGRAGTWREEVSPEQARRLIGSHGLMMRRLGYLDVHGHPAY